MECVAGCISLYLAVGPRRYCKRFDDSRDSIETTFVGEPTRCRVLAYQRSKKMFPAKPARCRGIADDTQLSGVCIRVHFENIANTHEKRMKLVFIVRKLDRVLDPMLIAGLIVPGEKTDCRSVTVALLKL